MNNIEELICQSRIKEISCGSSPLIGEKERLALTALYWHQEHQAAVEAFQETGRNLLLAQEQITGLIAQLEAAQRDRNLHYRVSEKFRIEQEKEGEILIDTMASMREWKLRAEAAETALSAANAKLSKPVVLPKKVYLKSSRCNVISWSKTFDAIEAAGFTVEGNADEK
ncbi:hypothetical protein [Yersinia intermedia]|uniref:hypothetical protein n=1 Tax=Yersinia intermedia TaxID=631 RepID=UPI0022FDBC49|nr:hypothetical protein [Yersinia intermedia]MDA5510526.1 hypothetical protein [Yersinia intermedia]